MERTLALVPRRIVDAHLSVDDIAAMIDGRLPATRRAAVEAHLAECSQCRREFVDASAVVGSTPASSPRWSRRWIPLVAAAAIVVVAVPLIRGRGTSARRGDERTTSKMMTTISTLAPASDSRPMSDSLAFTWHAVSGVNTYTLSVTDSAGAPIYRTNTGDTVVGPIAKLRLTPGASYYWNVDALNSDGSSIKSAPVSFSVRDR
jgi:hypothetical protein